VGEGSLRWRGPSVSGIRRPWSKLTALSTLGRGKSRMTVSLLHEIILVPPVGQTGREQLRQECYNVRINVFHHEQGFSMDAEIDELSLITPLVKGFCLFPRTSQTRRDG
jgi:hypothetical protein